MKKIIFLILTLLLLISCGKTELEKNYTDKTDKDGIKTYSNKNIPANSNLEVVPIKQFTINGETEDSLASFKLSPVLPQMDSKGNIYIYDSQSIKIKKFDKKGKYLLSMGGRGNGPGEFQMTNSFSVLNDTVYVVSPMTGALITYDSNGKFLKNITPPAGSGLPMMLKSAGENFIGYKMIPEMVDANIKLNIKTVLMDRKFNDLKELSKNSVTINPANMAGFNPMELISFFSVSDKQIYIAKKSKHSFVINVYDIMGNKKEVIEKDYMKITYTKEELKTINDQMAKAMKSAGNIAEKSEIELKIDSKDKEAISGMFVDKNNLLWVETSRENSFTDLKYAFDIFKDGIFQKSVTIKLEKKKSGDSILLIKDEIIEIDFENSKITFYNY